MSERRETPGGWAGRGVCAAALALAVAGGCSSATVVRQDDSPRVKTVPGEGTYRWEPERGWIHPRYGAPGTPEETRVEAVQAYEAGAYADALAGFLALEKLLPAADPSVVENLFRIGECYYRLGHYQEAAEYYTRVYRNSNSSPETTQESHRRIYDIAMDYLHGKADCSFLGIRYSCPGEGIEMLVGDDGLITEYRYLEFADDAIMEIAAYYYDRKQYPEAVPFYERVVREYCPTQDEWCELAEYQLGMATLKQVRGIDYDQSILFAAERKFRSYLQGYPRGPHAEPAREHLRDISDMLAEHYLRVAKHYLRESQPRAARIYLTLVLEKYTSSGAAREAREIQRRLDGMGPASSS